ncbi:MAG: hypothetical protein CL940_06125 [Deltaproteobacteria bacterium]|nr:hypothetical protein [Deltaproteobacteria bacterium]
MSDGEDRTEETPETPEATPEAEESVEAAAEATEAPEAAPAEAAPAPEAPAPEDESEKPIRMAPHAEGLFETEEIDISKIDDAELGTVYGEETGRSRAAISALVATIALVAVGTIMIFSDENMKHDIDCFVNGTVEECKTAEVAKTKEMWKNEDHKSQNKYGDVQLTFFPADAKVKITQTQKHLDGDAWRTTEGLSKCPADDATVGGAEEAEPKPGAAPAEAAGEPVKGAVDAAKFKPGTSSREIPNETTKLAVGQTIERLPLENLPIFETQKNDLGCVSDVLTYEYEVEFKRDGYHPIKRTWRVDDWKRIGPGNMIIEWPGLDLEPKPETIKANFSKVMHQEHCLRTQKKLPTLADSMKDENFEIMLLRNGIKTREDFMKIYDNLTKTAEHAEWWKGEVEKIKAQNCEE